MTSPAPPPAPLTQCSRDEWVLARAAASHPHFGMRHNKFGSAIAIVNDRTRDAQRLNSSLCA